MNYLSCKEDSQTPIAHLAAGIPKPWRSNRKSKEIYPFPSSAPDNALLKTSTHAVQLAMPYDSKLQAELISKSWIEEPVFYLPYRR